MTSGAGEVDDAALSPMCGMNPTLTRFLYERRKWSCGRSKYTEFMFYMSKRRSCFLRRSDGCFTVATRLDIGALADAVTGRRASSIRQPVEAKRERLLDHHMSPYTGLVNNEFKYSELCVQYQ